MDSASRLLIRRLKGTCWKRPKKKKKKRAASNSFCCDLCSEGEVSLRVSGLFCSTSPNIMYFSAGYFIRRLPKIKHFLTLICLLSTIIFVVDKYNKVRSVSEKPAVWRGLFTLSGEEQNCPTLWWPQLIDQHVKKQHCAILPLWVQKSVCISQELHPA